MRAIASFTAVVAVLGSCSMSLAVDQAWFSLESSCSCQVFQGPGQPLRIISEIGSQSLTIGYNFTNTFNGGMAGWAFALNSGNPFVTFSDGANAGLAGYDSSVGGTNGTNSFFAGQTSIPGTGAAGLAYKFNLNLSLTPIINVVGDFGPSEQYYGQGSGFAWFGRVGPNPASYGRTGYNADGTIGWGQLPVIVITTPEPATIGVLSVGAILTLRRRRARMV